MCFRLISVASMCVFQSIISAGVPVQAVTGVVCVCVFQTVTTVTSFACSDLKVV